MAQAPGRLRALKKRFKDLEKKGVFALPGVVVHLNDATPARCRLERDKLARERPEARYHIVINTTYV